MEYKKISELTAVVTGGTPSTNVAEYWDTGDIPWLQSGCCQNCDVDSAEKFITQSGYENSSTKMMPPDTVMIALTGATAGKIGYLKFSACGNQSITGILPSDALDQRYLFYYLMSKRIQILSDCIGGAQPHISQGYVKDILIPVLPIEEQKKIALILTNVDGLIVSRQQQLSKLDDLVKSRFTELFGDVNNEETLANLCTFIDYRGKTPEKTDSGLPFITAKNVKMHYMSFDTQEFISKETYDKVMTRGFPKVGDVVFTTEAPLGNVCRIPYIATEFYIGQRIITMQTNCLEPAYLEYALASDDFKRKIAEKSSGSTVTGIRSKLLEQLTIPVPPLELQHQFAAFVEQVDKSKSAVKKSLEKLETLKKSLMQQYFG